MVFSVEERSPQASRDKPARNKDKTRAVADREEYMFPKLVIPLSSQFA